MAKEFETTQQIYIVRKLKIDSRRTFRKPYITDVEPANNKFLLLIHIVAL